MWFQSIIAEQNGFKKVLTKFNYQSSKGFKLKSQIKTTFLFNQKLRNR